MAHKIAQYFYKLALVVLISFSYGCSDNSLEDKDPYAGWTKEKIYSQAIGNIDESMYRAATEDLEALESHYPFGDYAEKAKLLSIYTYMNSGKYDMAQAAAERFIEMHPNHEHVDYAYFMLGLSDFYIGLSSFKRYLPVNRHEIEQSSGHNAFFHLANFVKKFPQSQYANCAVQRMIYLKNSFAEHELYIAKQYFGRKAYLAAANRANVIIEDFQGTSSVPDALEMLSITYTKMGLPEKSQAAQSLLDLNYPNYHKKVNQNQKKSTTN